MVFMDFDPRYKHFELKRKKTTTERLQEGIDESQRLDKDRKLPFIPQVPVLPSMISINNPYDISSFSPVPIGSIYPNEENKPSFPIPREKNPPSVGNHASVVTEPVTPQEQNSKPEPSFWDKFSRFSQSDVSKNIDDFLMGAITASPDSSGWQLFAKGLKNLHEGDKQRGQVNQTVEYLKSRGYSEEEAAIMARNPQMLSALLTGGDTPKLLAGHEWYTDPETGERGQRPMTGTLQKLEYNQKKRDIEEWEIGKRNTAATAAKEINHIVDTVNNALQIIEKNPKKATGKVGTIAQIIPESDAKTLKNKLKTLEGGVFVRVIEAIKKQSDGGRLGVGPLSNEESRRIVASYGTMDISDKPEELYKTLLKIKDMFDLFKKLNDEEIYRLSNGMEVRSRLKYSTQYTNQSMSQGGVENLPTISSREDIKKLAIGDKATVQHGNYIYEIIRDR
ncbi:hypothetical protein ABID23_001624 [Bartonella silvatica]|uniref:Uncharacterized protein n=1 Tax=Bartonella silvatica TaxID=357760 RepID=A0ABV2HJ59_9HYPH